MTPAEHIESLVAEVKSLQPRKPERKVRLTRRQQELFEEMCPEQ